MNILVFGAGAIGCFIGGRLAADGRRVTLLGRPALMAKIAADGLRLDRPGHSSQTVRPETAVDLAGPSPPFDFILLTVKTYDVARAIDGLRARPALLEGAHLVSLQNGLGSEEQLAAAFGPEKIIAGTLTLPIRIPGPGAVEVSKPKGGIGLAPLDPGQPVGRLAGALDRAGLAAAVYDDYRALKWSKLLLNMVNNAACAILNRPPAQIVADPRLFNLEIEALREAVAVMRAGGVRAVRLPGYPVDWLVRLLAARWLPLAVTRAVLRPFLLGGRGGKMPSLQIDLAAGRPASEVDALNGAVVRAGQDLGIATPANRALRDTLQGLVSGRLDWDAWQRHPHRLLEAVAANRPTGDETPGDN
ncbi:MAG: ketopantoate reductase family protein [Anaerolineae bacterium]